ncbi:vWA-MoxR associated conflict system protein [Streptomyces olivaceus]|uniref:vWA-MoxR associated conflict system protein n=1 Tax=Streptomyces olivaceus TaxID=47716 RepID=UPI0036667D37
MIRTAEDPPRHVLVIGGQCEGGARLEGLEEAARALHRVLTDPKLGGCVDRGEESLLIGTSLGRNRVIDAVEQAAEAARRDRGCLVLALLGHGEGAEGAPLHFVTSGRTGDPELVNVDVPSLLGSVANHPGLNGLIAIVDTCLAGGAAPATPSVTVGRQDGAIRFSLLFAATAKEPAFDLRLSREVTRLIEDGLPGAGHYLKIDDGLMQQLRNRIEGQQPGQFTFDGGAYVGDGLWLAHNRTISLDRTLGSIASKAMHDAVCRIDPNLQLSSEQELDAWLRQNEQAADGRSRAAYLRLREVLADLQTGNRSLAVLKQVFGQDLTEERLQLAAMLAGLPLSFLHQEPPRSVREVVEYAVHHGSSAQGKQRTLAHLVAAMTHVTGQGDLPRGVLAWAQELELIAMANSRLRDLSHQPHEEAAPRLVVVLDDDGGEHVVRMEAWLLYGRAILGRQRFPCAGGGEYLRKALADVITWVSPWANLAGKRLKRIDVAAPTLVLLDSPAEDQVVRRQKLGANYTVTTRWSGLLTPPPDITVHEMLQVGQQLLDSMNETCSGPAWLRPHEVKTVEQLQTLLVNRGFGQQVWGVACLPEIEWELVAQELLEHTPALIWPRQKIHSDERMIKESVLKHWQGLPQQIADAYRQHLSGNTASDDGRAPLAAVRAAWHDEDWQAFCMRRARAAVTAPDEMMFEEQA